MEIEVGHQKVREVSRLQATGQLQPRKKTIFLPEKRFAQHYLLDISKKVLLLWGRLHAERRTAYAEQLKVESLRERGSAKMQEILTGLCHVMITRS